MRRSLTLAAAVMLLAAPPAMAAGEGVNRPPHHHQPTVGDAAVRIALRYRGTPYVWAGTTPAGFDCSGFTRFVYGRLGISLPHSSYAQWDAGRHLTRRQLRPGDIVFFGIGHVGIWIGGGKFIHAPHTGTVVSIDRLDRGWYAASFTGGVRIPGAARPLHHRTRHHSRGALTHVRVERLAIA